MVSIHGIADVVVLVVVAELAMLVLPWRVEQLVLALLGSL